MYYVLMQGNRNGLMKSEKPNGRDDLGRPRHALLPHSRSALSTLLSPLPPPAPRPQTPAPAAAPPPALPPHRLLYFC
jgi:hypothetical protein